jgi:hypothetical protein
MPGTVVGEIFRKRAIRAPVNPLDKSTIVSVYPREVDEKKVTLSPNRWIIPPGTPETPSVTIIGPASWWREIDEEQPLLEIPVSSVLIAESIVKDWMNGMVGCDMSESMPGLFYVPGECTLKEIQEKYSKALQLSIHRQNNWFNALVRQGDSLWPRSRFNPMVITDDMRLAAKQLGLDRDWLTGFKQVGMVRCKACGALRDPEFPICKECHAIDDPEKAAKLGIKFAS